MKKVDALVGFLAYPNDVTEYREKAKEAFFEWNVLNSLNQDVFLLPINWADNVRPDSGGTPQQLIDRQLLDDCDFLIGIFWQRLGTPVEKAPSGTAHEIQLFIKRGKSCMIYFSDQKIEPSTFDSREQTRLLEFKRQLEKKSVYSRVESPEDFKKQLMNDLTKLVYEYKKENKNEGSSTLLSPPIEEDLVEGLSIESIRLLLGAYESEGSLIILGEYIGGINLSAGNFNVKLDYSTRETAIWEEAIEQLELAGLIKQYGDERGMYSLTTKGFKVGDGLVEDKTNLKTEP